MSEGKNSHWSESQIQEMCLEPTCPVSTHLSAEGVPQQDSALLIILLET